MNTVFWSNFLLWCAVFNYGLLLLGFAAYARFHEPIQRLHGRWFALSPSAFDASAYLIFGLYKIAIWMFLIVPYFVLRFVL